MVVAVVADLIFQSKIAGVASHLGIEARFERSVAAASAAAVEANGVLIDLTVDERASIELIHGLRQAHPGLKIVAFFPHVQAELGRQARAAGADHVLTRSKFTERLPDLLGELAGSKTASHWPDSADPL